jgi:hypothetical protein
MQTVATMVSPNAISQLPDPPFPPTEAPTRMLTTIGTTSHAGSSGNRRTRSEYPRTDEYENDDAGRTADEAGRNERDHYSPSAART